MPSTKDTVPLALRFAQEIRAWYSEDDDHYVGDEKWNDMLFRNRAGFAERGSYGATNDDYDANMAMDAAWHDVLPGVEMDAGAEEHAVLINDAWALAAGNEFDDRRIREEAE